MSNALATIIAILAVIAFGLWIYSMFRKQDFLDILKEIWEKITNE